MKTYIAFDIEYDTDGEDVGLPNELEIAVPCEDMDSEEDVLEYVSDEISNITGFCHFGFSMKPKEEN